MCNYPAARRGDESSSAALFPAFPNDPAEHLLSEYSMQMMQLESPLADCFPRHRSAAFSPRLLHCLLHCSSPPSPLLDPIKASQQRRLGGRGDTLEPQARLALGTSHTSLSLPGAGWVTARSLCSLGSALPNPGQLTFGQGKQGGQAMPKAGQKCICTAALCFNW